MLHRRLELRWKIEGETARADEAGHHPRARSKLKDVEQHLALAEAIQEDAHCREVEGMRSKPYQVAVDTRKLAEQHPTDLRAGGNLAVEHLLYRERVHEVVVQRAKVISAIRKDDRLLVGL